MAGIVTKPDVARVLRGLRNFQRDSVEYVFDRMYGSVDPVSRFLVADEVGLGKTLVARGMIAKVVDRLWDEVERIDIIYICSNASIARQNVARLNITDQRDIALPSRITLLPSRVRDLKRSRLNFVSFTPGTSFNLRSATGTVEERALLYKLLSDEWKEHRGPAETLLSGWASRKTFDAYVSMFEKQSLDETIRSRFHDELLRRADGDAPLLTRFQTLCTAVGRRQNLDPDERLERDFIIGELRAALAASCIEALEPDLIILDEFQRFKDLLHNEDETTTLARHLFGYDKARVLLLSATPYKMYTLDDEAGAEDHFDDFVKTLSFLYGDSTHAEKFKNDLNAYRRELLRYGAREMSGAAAAREAVTASLRRVMVRTERLAVTADRNGMLKDVASPPAPLEHGDIDHYLSMQRVSRAVDGGDTIEYWKSAPYLLNFMDDYDVKRRFTSAVESGKSPELFDAISSASGALLSPEDLEKYRQIDPANARLRALIADLDRNGAWDVGWIPPSMPYYEPSAAFSGAAGMLTKRLIFSSWQVVPKAVAAMLSYEAERRLWRSDGTDDGATRGARERSGRTLRFSLKEGKPSNMTLLGLIYPSFTLATEYDPMQTALRLQKEAGGRRPSLEAVLRDTAEKLAAPLGELASAEAGGAPDESWYWAAPLLLDLQRNRDAAARWLGQGRLKDEWRPPVHQKHTDGAEDGDPRSDAWYAHVDELRRVEKMQLGRQPADLPQVLALIAVAGFGVVALRALARVTGDLSRTTPLVLRNSAGQVADAFLSLFNLPEIEAMVHRSKAQEPYWLRVLEYAAAGGVQALVDEYAHILVDALGQKGKSLEDIAVSVSREISGALRTRTANLGVDYIGLDAASRRVTVQSTPGAFRTRFAVRFGARATEEGAPGERDDVVRRAFNSPFWPFVLCSTSVGQEGLDFHQYCHAVVHWNVPSNPVDLEQREGRVHRYKNHAVRKNVAAECAGDVDPSKHPDPWLQVFQCAAGKRTESSDLTPFWVFPKHNGAHVERHIPLFPLSADWERAERVRRALAVYRLAFGQNRQQDLVSYLTQTLSPSEIQEAMDLFRIDLSPPRFHGAVDFEPLDEVAPERGLVQVEADDTAGHLDLNAMADLLDAFTALAAAAKSRFSAETVANLLNDFARLKGDDRVHDVHRH